MGFLKKDYMKKRDVFCSPQGPCLLFFSLLALFFYDTTKKLLWSSLSGRFHSCPWVGAWCFVSSPNTLKVFLLNQSRVLLGKSFSGIGGWDPGRSGSRERRIGPRTGVQREPSWLHPDVGSRPEEQTKGKHKTWGKRNHSSNDRKESFSILQILSHRESYLSPNWDLWYFNPPRQKALILSFGHKAVFSPVRK